MRFARHDPGDVVWEPFGGLCTAAVAALRSDRACYAAEVEPDVYEAAVDRLKGAALDSPLQARQ